MFYKLILIFVFTYNYTNLIETSNVDTFHPIFINNIADGPESLFGVSILLSKDDNDSPGVIIGAPRANSTLNAQKTIHEPGVIWQCSFERKSEVCRIVPMDETGNVRDSNRVDVTDKKDGGWLGGSIVQDSENFVSCASRWSNQFYTEDNNRYFMNGICYWRPRAEIFENNLPAPSPESRLLPLIQSDKQPNNNWGLGQAGFSIHIPFQTKEMIIGAPGVRAGKGSVIRYSSDASGNPFKKFLVIRPEKSPEKDILQDNSYFGYTVGSGKFFSDNSKDAVQYVSGAPRGNNLAGEVIVFRFPETDNDPLEILFKIDGKQIGSFFGSSICISDINGDGIDDLLVGAPHYTIQTKIQSRFGPVDKRSFSTDRFPGYGDEGAVFVYLSTGTALIEQPGLTYLNGRNRAWSHFGTAIVNIGDINKDGFSDIAVGAPYEKEGTGVVYIYHGGKNGIVKQATQTIEASKLSSMLKGFGYSFSERQDIDNNGYNDLAIGAYDSGQVVILRTSPSMVVTGVVKSKLERLSFDATSFEIESCVSYTGEYLPDKIDLKVKIISDVESRPPRVLVEIPEQSGSTAPEHEYVEEMFKGRESCTKFIAAVKRPLESSGKPVVIRQEIAVYEKTKSEHPTVYNIEMSGDQFVTTISGEDYTQFCKDCPMLDKTKSKIHDLHLPLAVLCGDDDRCVSDLKLTIKFAEIVPQRPYVIGFSQVLSMEVKVTNLAETAISPSVLVSWKKTNLRKTPSECQVFHENTTISSYKCALGKLLEEEKSSTVLLEFDMTNLVAGSLEELWFHVEANTASEMAKPSFQTVTIPVIAIADIFISGSSSAEELNPATLVPQLNFFQTFEIGLDGPSPIAGSIIEFLIPVSFTMSSGSTTTIQVYEPRKTISKGSINCYAVNGNFAMGQNPTPLAVSSLPSLDIESPAAEVDLTPENLSNPLKVNVNPSNQENVGQLKSKKASEVQIECGSTSSECIKVRCLTETFYSDTSATITFPMTISSSNLKRLFRSKEISSLKIMSQGNLRIKNTEVKIEPYSNKPDDAVATTVIQLESTKKVSKWIYWAAVVIGFLVLAILVSCLYSCGCFERKTKPESEEENTEEAIPLQEATPFNSDNLDDEADITKDEDD